MNAEALVLRAPFLDHCSESMVRNHIKVSQHLIRHRTLEVPGFQPRVNALPIVGYPGGQCDRIFHQVKRYRTEKMLWDHELVHVEVARRRLLLRCGGTVAGGAAPSSPTQNHFSASSIVQVFSDIES